jgi:plastocyanin
MKAVRASFVVVSLLAAGCGLFAGLEDIEYGEPATAPSPTDPAVAEADAEGVSGESGADAAATPSDGGDGGDVQLEASVTVEPEEDAGDVPDDDDAGNVLAGCTLADFAANDRRAPGASRTITFPVAGPPLQYAPRCLRIKAGQSVTWQGDLAADPLVPLGKNPPSPITPTAVGNSVTFTFANKGRYRYASQTNPAMRGAIDVRP